MSEDEMSGSDRPARQMYDAVCSKCGQPCQVPFKPAEGRPVYCRNCYRPRRSRY
ncbi:MAG: CxxC-x17-CxxC domain-containing protein [Candidatus Bilamarchaeaceae archaeon]